MAPRDVLVLRARLEDIAASATSLSRAAEDLYGIAYERGSGVDVKVSGGGGQAGLDTVGDARAKRLWRRLEKHVKASELALRALVHGAGNLLAEGETDDRLRFGSAITAAELDALVSRQAGRRARGEYTPARTEEQPAHPARKKRKAK